MNKQIKALKMAIKIMEATQLGELAQGLSPSILLDDAINACKEALAEADKQKPVASQMSEPNKMVMLQPNGIVYENKENSWHFIGRMVKDVDALCDEYYNRGKRCAHPATWQSLSDDEITDMHHEFVEFDSVNNETIFDPVGVARAIEQALKEKNYE